MCRYLRRIRTVWDHILDNREDARQRLDATTVSTLQGLFPKRCTADMQEIKRKSAMIMPLLPERERARVLDRIYATDGPIPSIHTFLEDTKLLEPCAKILKSLLPGGCKTSIYREYMKMHNSQSGWARQLTDGTREEECNHPEVAKNKAYRQLWLFALRHFPEMLGQSLRKDRGESTPATPPIEIIWRFALIRLAQVNGFVHLLADYRDEEGPTKTMAEAFLPQARPPLLYEYTNEEALNGCEAVFRSINKVGNFKSGEASRHASPPSHHCGQGIEYRCGVPHNNSFRLDQAFLFLHHVDDIEGSQQTCSSMTSFAVKQQFFWAFLGRPDGASPPSSDGIRNRYPSVFSTQPVPTPLASATGAEEDESMRSAASADELQTSREEFSGEDEPMEYAPGPDDEPIQTSTTSISGAVNTANVHPIIYPKQQRSLNTAYYEARRLQIQKKCLMLVSTDERGGYYDISSIATGNNTWLQSVGEAGNVGLRYDSWSRRVKPQNLVDPAKAPWNTAGPLVICISEQFNIAKKVVEELERNLERRAQMGRDRIKSTHARQQQQQQQQQQHGQHDEEEEEEEEEL